MPPKVKKKLNGRGVPPVGAIRRTDPIRGTGQPHPPPTVKRDPKLWKKVKDPAGFWKWEKRKTGAKALPPSVRAKREERAKQPPPVKYRTEKAPQKTQIPKPLPKSQPDKPKPKSQAAKRRALRTTGGRKLFGQRRTGTTAKWPSSKRMTYKGMSADTRSGSFPQAPFVISYEQKKRPTKPKRGR